MPNLQKLPKWIALSSIVVNLVIFGIKAVLALNIDSLALLSDSIHTLSDSASSVAVYIGLKISERPPDKGHPFGHGRAEQVALLAVGLLLAVAALKFLTDGILSLFTGTRTIQANLFTYVLILITAVMKEAMGEASYLVGKKTELDSLKADAWHHRSDAITTVLVVLSIYGSQSGYAFLDPLAGIAIALLLGYIGISYTKKATNRLLGTAPPESLISGIEKIADRFDRVRDVHDIKVHDYGKKKAISLHMNMDSGTVRAAHEVSHRLQEVLEKKFNANVEIHLDPWSPPDGEIEGVIDEIAESYDEIQEVHKIRFTDGKKRPLISMHVLVPGEESIERAHEVGTRFERRIKERLDERLDTDTDIQVHIEPYEEEKELNRDKD